MGSLTEKQTYTSPSAPGEMQSEVAQPVQKKLHGALQVVH
jgi:hypothetical protein